MLTTTRVAELRHRTPAVAHHIHFNHASTSLPALEVTDSVTAYLREESAAGAHAVLRARDGDLRDARQRVANLLGAPARNIAFTGTATQSWALALGAAVAGGARQLTTVRNEWGPNFLNAFRMAEPDRFAVTVVDPDDHGRLDPTAIMRDCAPGGIIAVPLVPTTSGMVNAVEELADAAAKRDQLLFVDAAQAVGQIPVSVEALGADVLVFPSRKWLRGPKGAAVLFVSDRALSRMASPPIIDQVGIEWDRDRAFSLRDDASRFESFEFNPGIRLGLGEAARLAREIGPANIQAAIRSLVEYLHEQFARKGLPQPFETIGGRTSGIVTFADPSLDVDAIAQELQRHSIFVASIGRNYARLELAARGVSKILRVSVHYFNTRDEVDALADRLAAAIRAGR